MIFPKAGVLQWQLELSTTITRTTPAPFPALRPTPPGLLPMRRATSFEFFPAATFRQVVVIDVRMPCHLEVENLLDGMAFSALP